MKNGTRVFFGLMTAFLVLLVLSCRKDPSSRCDALYGTGDTVLTVATGSPGELGLREKLAGRFLEDNAGTAVCWIKAGTGESLDLLKQGRADVIMVHAPEAEKRAVREGWAADRRPIGSNEFYIVGPRDDPAGIAKAKSAAEAYRRIAMKKATFISRGDNSGTHRKEMSLWRKAGVSPVGGWYVVTGGFMSASHRKADTLRGYFMTDSSTWVVEKGNCGNLRVLYKGDPALVNMYHALTTPAKGASLHQAGKFTDFLASDKGQEIIRTFGRERYGEALHSGNARADTSSR